MLPLKKASLLLCFAKVIIITQILILIILVIITLAK